MRRRYKRGKTGIGFIILFFIMSLISLGYAVLSSNLEIDGTAKISKATWDVHYENVSVTTGSVNAPTPEILDDTKIKYTVELTTPGDFYEFKFDVVNAGTIDAVINKLTETSLTDAQKNYLTYSLSYEDGNKISVGDELLKTQKKTLKIRLEFKQDIDATDLPSENEEIKMNLQTEYIQLGTATKPDWNEDGVLKVLAIGNSFTIDTMDLAYNVASDLGIENLDLEYLYISATSLANHLENAETDTASYNYLTYNGETWDRTLNKKMSEVVASQDWDYIMLQQLASESGHSDSYDDINPIISIIKDNLKEGANPKFVWNMTWATDENFGTFPDRISMYNGIISAVKDKVVTNPNIDVIVPVGTAIQNARTLSNIRFTKENDGHHLAIPDGRYVAALTLIKTLTGLDINDLNYVPADASDNLKDVAIKSVNAAYSKPFEIIGYSSEDTIDGDWNDDETLKVLLFGSDKNRESIEYLYQVAKDLGVKNVELTSTPNLGLSTLVTQLTSNNSAMPTTNNNGSWIKGPSVPYSEIIGSNDWDFIMLMQQTKYINNIGQYDSIDKVVTLVNSALQEGNNPKYIWNLNWAYDESGFNTTFTSQQGMYNTIIDAARSKVVNNENISLIVPTGTAIQNARTKASTLLTKTTDGDSLIEDAKYIGSVTFAKKVLGLNIDSLTYVPSETTIDNIKDLAIESAISAINKPFEITNLN